MRRRGFTLVELIAVLIILALIGSLAVSRVIDYRQQAKQSAEAGVVRAVRGAISMATGRSALSGTPNPPAALDPFASGTVASASTPLFGTVLESGITDAWTKGATANEYIGPTGTKYIYIPSNGAFATDAVASSGAGSGAVTSTSFTVANSWTAGAGSTPTLSSGTFVGAGYTMTSGIIELTDSGSFSEASRRTVITGQEIAAGSYTLNLDTRLTNYWNQLNYWQVYAVSAGSTLNLSGNALNWGTAPAGAKLLARDYAPDAKSNGNWFSYQTAFNVSAADASQYSQIVVIMAGTKAANQILSWRNISFTKVGP